MSTGCIPAQHKTAITAGAVAMVGRPVPYATEPRRDGGATCDRRLAGRWCHTQPITGEAPMPHIAHGKPVPRCVGERGGEVVTRQASV